MLHHGALQHCCILLLISRLAYGAENTVIQEEQNSQEQHQQQYESSSFNDLQQLHQQHQQQQQQKQQQRSELSNNPQLKSLLECEHSGPLGMITGQIRDWQITSSSVYPEEWDKGCKERYARVYQPNGLGWCAKYKSASEWLQIDLGVAAKITGVLTQGRNDGSEWVTSFMVSYSTDAYQWLYVTDLYGNQKVFEGNLDSYAVKHSYLDEPIIARYIKFHTVTWHRHPSMRVEIIGCQVCNTPIALPPFGKLTASSEKLITGGSSCQAEDGYILTNKAWCAKSDNVNQWLQFDVGPPTLITGLVTKGRGDSNKKHWVTRFRLSYSNDSNVWYFYKDASHLDIKRRWNQAASSDTVNDTSRMTLVPDRTSAEGLEFGANSDKDDERYHYLNSPFLARYIRFHPVDWHKHISMRAGLIGCPHTGECADGFIRVNSYTPCVENLAYRKSSWLNNRRQLKRHVRTQWVHGQAGRAVDGQVQIQSLSSCTILDNFYVDRPVWMVDLGTRAKVSGIIIHTWLGAAKYPQESAQASSVAGSASSAQKMSARDYMYNLDKLTVYVDNKGGREPFDLPENMCGYVSRLNDAIFKPRLHVQCKKPMKGRYVYIEAWGVPNRYSRLFSAVLCEVMVYQ